MNTKKECSEKVYPNDQWGAFHPHPCKIKAVIDRAGKSYCRLHDPVEKEKKEKERRKQYDKEWAQKEKAWKRKENMATYCSNLSDEELAGRVKKGLRA